MPFNIDFRNRRDQAGRLTIDRDNLIFQFIPASKDEVDYNAAIDLRTFFITCLELMMDKREEEAIITIHPMTDELHGIDDHVVNNDREFPHYHLKFNKMVDYEMVTRLLNVLPPMLMDEFMAKADKDFILTSVKGYFHELEVDPMAFQLEQEYRLIKQLHFKEEVKRQEIEDKKAASEYEPVRERKRKSTGVPFTLFPSVEASKKKPGAQPESKRLKIG